VADERHVANPAGGMGHACASFFVPASLTAG
jgi:hypothetical protein